MSIDSSNRVRLLKRRQIQHSRPCATATAHLLLRVVSAFKWTAIEKLIERIQQVGQRLCAAQPRELVVGNIVRRVLGLIREEAEDDRDLDDKNLDGCINNDGDSKLVEDSPTKPKELAAHRPNLSSSISAFSPLSHGATAPTDTTAVDTHSEAEQRQASSHDRTETPHRPPLMTSHTSYAVSNAGTMVTSMFNLLSGDDTPSAASTPTHGQSPDRKSILARINAMKLQRDLKPDIIGGIEEIIDELDQVDDQIAAYALEHIHSNEVILTYGSSLTVQKFLLKAAAKRKFTVVHAESYPNDHETTYTVVSGVRPREAENDGLDSDAFQKPLIAAGVTVILITDATVFAIMSRVNKVILGTHAVLANGGLVASAGSKMIAKAARGHRTPVVVVSGVYKLSPVYPFDFEALIEYGDASKIFPYQDGEMVDLVDVENPLYDYVPAELVDLYITNLLVSLLRF